jgi:hypothetical protein
MRAPCDCWVVVADDGIIVRWDKHESEDKPKVRLAWPQEGATTVEALAPGFSERYVYCVTDVAKFELPSDGQKLQLSTFDPATGELKMMAEIAVAVLVNWAEIQKQLPPTGHRPIPLVSVRNELKVDRLP